MIDCRIFDRSDSLRSKRKREGERGTFFLSPTFALATQAINLKIITTYIPV